MYDQLLQEISKPLPDHVFYKLLLDNANTILVQTSLTSKGEVAQDLGMNPTVFSTTYKFLFAYSLSQGA